MFGLKVLHILGVRSKFYFFTSLMLMLVCGSIDIMIALSIREFDVTDFTYTEFALFLARLVLYLLTNFSILTFSMHAEVDFKVSSVDASTLSNSKVIFNNYSHTSSHMFLTGVLRIISETMLAIVLLSTLIAISSEFTRLIAFGVAILVPAIIIYLRVARKSRVEATKEQTDFLDYGNKIIDISDVAKQIDTLDFLKIRIRDGSNKYTKSNRISLFFSQGMKPVFEFLAVLLLSFYLMLGNSLDMSSGYLAYRLASVAIVLVNCIPLAMHYYHNYGVVLREIQ
ncbi:membrane hypothetical protein [Vibrio nigripulchritudo MADA3029]|uniref:hypothetical protein n=1 Tax=Vibrio nigripulchritudo TaxID=28173 RepID=UPI0003B20DA2|nr:hypothetical protein [Vibrio nigripulchritudo]CCN47614.1 membrane hypothetical protein [Vibrio nigripulchritudo MADA3020]CCN56563.1 membrane hypothetical protein [Vibrio nigripulchritudo MADA3021]CCN58813.1 membrane hypothetical protein [Vibrio nigripulchritudo MADA3029]